jgi:hypothetical protein
MHKNHHHTTTPTTFAAPTATTPICAPPVAGVTSNAPRIFVEVRPGEGGDDASAFAEELCSAVSAHATRRGLGVVRDGLVLTL